MIKLWVCGAVSLFACVTSFGQTIRPAGADWSLALPAGWKQAPDSVVQSMNTQRDAEDPDHESFRHVAKFDPADSLGVGLPYITVEWTPYPEFAECNWQDIQEFYEGESMDPALASRPFSEIFAKISDASTMVDQSSARVYGWYDAPGEGPSGRTLRTSGVIFLSKKGAYEVCLYDKAEENNRYLGDLQKFATGFHLDPGTAFVPGPGLPKIQPQRASSTRSAFPFRFGIFGVGGLGGGIGLTLIIRKILQAD